MGFIDKMFKSQGSNKEPLTEIPWHNLTQMEELDALVTISKTQPVAIFKHSTSCGVSKMVLKRLQRDFNLEMAAHVQLYFLDLLAYRPISKAVAQKLEVTHESPQLLIIKDGKAVFHASHQDITFDSIQEYNSL